MHNKIDELYEYLKSQDPTITKMDVKEFVVLQLLQDTSYKFRKKSTLIRASEMTEEEFNNFITKNYREIQRSSIPSADGEELYKLSSYFYHDA